MRPAPVSGADHVPAVPINTPLALPAPPAPPLTLPTPPTPPLALPAPSLPNNLGEETKQAVWELMGATAWIENEVKRGLYTRNDLFIDITK
jgi:hypothetical protein